MAQSDIVTNAFYEWERRGRGWSVFSVPVDSEPAYAPFIPPESVPDVYDSGRVTLGTTLQKLFTSQKKIEEKVLDEEAFQFEAPSPPRVFQFAFHDGEVIDRNREKQLLTILGSSQFPVTFELCATYEKVAIQIVLYEPDVLYVQNLIATYLPSIRMHEVALLPFDFGDEAAIVDFGLANEFMTPLRVFDAKSLDPLLPIYSAARSLYPDEGILLQCSFKGVLHSWSKAMLDAVVLPNGQSFFLDAPELAPLAQEKAREALYAVNLRLVSAGQTKERSTQLFDACKGFIRSFERSDGNALIPLSNSGIDVEDHIACVVLRQSMRTGMILNVSELHSLAHLPSNDPGLNAFFSSPITTHLAPKELHHGRYAIGTNEHAGIANIVFLNDTDRLRHMHVIGATGVGKSTFLTTLALCDIELGNGVCVCDPHGDLIDDILLRIPESRIADVVLVDPGYQEYAIGLNLLRASTEAEKLFLGEDLLSIIRGQSSTWGDQMEQVLAHAIAVFLDRPQGGTLLELRRFLSDDGFRKKCIVDVSDYMTRNFWEHEFDGVHKRAITSILTRLDSFLRPRILRAMMAHHDGLDFGSIISEKKILLLKLSHGAIGESNAHLLGSLFITKLYQAALARQSRQSSERSPFYVYIDEFHHFKTKSLTGMLTGARKYGLGLILAHQNVEQVNSDRELSTTLLANAHIQVCFRLGTSDAQMLERGFAHFTSSDFTELPIGCAITRVGSTKADFNMRTEMLHIVDQRNEQRLNETLRRTGVQYGASVEKIEATYVALFTNPPVTKKEEPASQKSIEVQQPIQEIEEPTPVIQVTEESVSDFEKTKQEFLGHEQEKKEQREHEYIKSHVVSIAQSFGWKAQREVSIVGGRIDVLLQFDQVVVGVEVSVTNTKEYEVKNIQKCLSHGCSSVLFISNGVEKVKYVKSKLDSADLSRVHFLSSSELSEWLMRNTPVSEPKEMRIRGYRVKVKYN